MTRTNAWYDGVRVRHWNGKNSVKLYNEQNVLRIEMTMNDPSQYKIHHHSENQDISEPKKYLPIRKGIADINVCAKVSSDTVDRFTVTSKKLGNTPWAKNISGKQLSGRISYHLSLLREYGLIKKLPNQHKYSLTEKGRKLTTSICVAQVASVIPFLKHIMAYKTSFYHVFFHFQINY